MDNAAWQARAREQGEAQPQAKVHRKSRSERMSDHIAYALLVYTGLLIFSTMTALTDKGGSISLLPYFSLVFLVAAIIPSCRKLEARWQARDESGTADDPDASSAFTRDIAVLWTVAIGLPFALTALAKAVLG